MKKLLLASAIAALSVSAANAAPTVYGKAFVTADYVDAEKNENGKKADSDSVQINSNSSRIGFKGSEAMTANTDVIYQLEYGIDIDNDSGKAFKNRDTYLGLKNKSFGEFRAGHNQSTADFVNNVVVTDALWDNLGDDNNMVDSGRIKNSVIWKAPTYNNMPVQFAAMYAADESFVEDSDDRNNGFGAALMFDQGTGFSAGVSYDNDVNVAGDLIRGTVSVDLAKLSNASLPLTIGGLYQEADIDDAKEKEKGFVVSAEMGLQNFARPASIYAQYNNTSNLRGAKDVDSDQIVIGGKYHYQKNMIMHAYAGQNTVDNGSNDVDQFGIGAGLEYKF